jgi:hypothetical protein
VTIKEDTLEKTTKPRTRKAAARKADAPTILAIKGMNHDMTCRSFKFEPGQSYEVSGRIAACENGFHSCPLDGETSPLSVFQYYAPGISRYFEVEASGETDRQGDKIASAKLTIGVEVGVGELTRRFVDWVIGRAKPNGAASNSGDYGAASNSGDYGAASNSGAQQHYGAASNSGDYGAASNSGARGAASNSGYSGAASNSGDYGAASNSGDSRRGQQQRLLAARPATAATTARPATAATTARPATAATTARPATAATTARPATAATRGAASNSGDSRRGQQQRLLRRGQQQRRNTRGAASNSGDYGAAFSHAYGGKVMCEDDEQALYCTEFASDGAIVSVACGITGRAGIEAGKWYVCKNGQLAEAA